LKKRRIVRSPRAANIGTLDFRTAAAPMDSIIGAHELIIALVSPHADGLRRRSKLQPRLLELRHIERY
jgi:hypothetical protein